MRKNLGVHSLLFVFIMGFSCTGIASDQHHSHDPKTSKNETHQHNHDEESKGHHATPHWAKSLDKEQKKAVDDMHHELDRMQEPLIAEEQQKQNELNMLTVQDNASLEAINQKIDELMAIKNKILRNRYDHLVEMRVILNAEQRVSYDEAIMKRDKIK